MRALLVSLVVGLSALTGTPAMAAVTHHAIPVRQVQRGRIGHHRGRGARLHGQRHRAMHRHHARLRRR